MKPEMIREILDRTDMVRTSGSAEEKSTAEYLKSLCEAYGAAAHLESFDVDLAEIREAKLTADGGEIPCKGYALCGSGEIRIFWTQARRDSSRTTGTSTTRTGTSTRRSSGRMCPKAEKPFASTSMQKTLSSWSGPRRSG